VNPMNEPQRHGVTATSVPEPPSRPGSGGVPRHGGECSERVAGRRFAGRPATLARRRLRPRSVHAGGGQEIAGAPPCCLANVFLSGKPVGVVQQVGRYRKMRRHKNLVRAEIGMWWWQVWQVRYVARCAGGGTVVK